MVDAYQVTRIEGRVSRCSITPRSANGGNDRCWHESDVADRSNLETVAAPPKPSWRLAGQEGARSVPNSESSHIGWDVLCRASKHRNACGVLLTPRQGGSVKFRTCYDTERDLLYVACTRARDELLVSRPRLGVPR